MKLQKIKKLLDQEEIQINSNKSHPSQEFSGTTTRQDGVGILIVSESNKERKEWFYDKRINAAINL